MNSRLGAMGTSILAVAAAAATGCGGNTSQGSSSPETIGGAGGDLGGVTHASSSSTGSGPPQVTLESFKATSVGLGRGVTVSISDVAGPAGCALAADASSAPPAGGHQIVVHGFATGLDPCDEGTYPIEKDCGPDPFADISKNCAAYRVWAAGAITGEDVAVSGSLTLAYSTDWGGSCNVDVTLGFGAKGTYTRSFTVLYDTKSPLCTVPGP
jgi:hypothetical protein